MKKNTVILLVVAAISAVLLIYLACRPWVQTYQSIRAAAVDHDIPEVIFTFPHRGPVTVEYYYLLNDVTIKGTCDTDRFDRWLSPSKNGAFALEYPAGDFDSRFYGLIPNVEVIDTRLKAGSKTLVVYAQPRGRFAVVVSSNKGR